MIVKFKHDIVFVFNTGYPNVLDNLSIVETKLDEVSYTGLVIFDMLIPNGNSVSQRRFAILNRTDKLNIKEGYMADYLTNSLYQNYCDSWWKTNIDILSRWYNKEAIIFIHKKWLN